MSFKHLRETGLEPSNRSRALDQITADIGALREPSPSLFVQFHQERERGRAEKLAALERDIEAACAEGHAAALRLLSLDAPSRETLNRYTEYISPEVRDDDDPRTVL